MNRTETICSTIVALAVILLIAFAGYYTNETKIKRATLDKQTCPCVKGKQ